MEPNGRDLFFRFSNREYIRHVCFSRQQIAFRTSCMAHATGDEIGIGTRSFTHLAWRRNGNLPHGRGDLVSGKE